MYHRSFDGGMTGFFYPLLLAEGTWLKMHSTYIVEYIVDYLSLQVPLRILQLAWIRFLSVLRCVYYRICGSIRFDQLILMGTVQPACFTFSSSCPAYANTAHAAQ